MRCGMKKHEIQVARGLERADLVLKNGNVLNVFSEEILTADVAIVDNRIVGIGAYSGEREIDCTGKYIVPGFIDAHVHVESSMVSPLEFAKYIVKKGTTTIIADPHEIVNVCGKQGMDYMLSASQNVPVDMFMMVPSCVPASDVDVNGAGDFLAKDMEEYRCHPRVKGLGEVMRFGDVLEDKEEIHDKLKLFSDMTMDGHAPGLLGKDLQAYRLAGISNDHECSTVEEGLQKLRAGYRILIREGSGAKNLENLVQGFLEANICWERCMFCTDDKHLEEIEKEGHINACVQKAIALGVPIVTAYKMASYNAAQAYQLGDLGAVAAGYRANILVVDDLREAKASKIIKDGVEVDEKWLSSFKYELENHSLLQTVTLKEFSIENLRLKKKDANDVMELVPYELLTLHKKEVVPGKDGFFVPNQTYAKLAVVERHGKTGNVAVCPMKGYGIRKGAIATTVSHDSHNIIAVGDNDEDILRAILELERIQGGYVIVSEERVVDSLPLLIAGLMSDRPAQEVQKKIGEMVKRARKMGVCDGVDPFTTLSFMALTVIPEIRLIESGIFDVCKMKLIKDEAK